MALTGLSIVLLLNILASELEKRFSNPNLRANSGLQRYSDRPVADRGPYNEARPVARSQQAHCCQRKNQRAQKNCPAMRTNRKNKAKEKKESRKLFS